MYGHSREIWKNTDSCGILNSSATNGKGLQVDETAGDQQFAWAAHVSATSPQITQ